MKFELTEAELKLRDELDAALEAWQNGSLKTYTHEEFWTKKEILLKQLLQEQKKTARKKQVESEFGNLAIV